MLTDSLVNKYLPTATWRSPVKNRIEPNAPKIGFWEFGNYKQDRVLQATAANALKIVGEEACGVALVLVIPAETAGNSPRPDVKIGAPAGRVRRRKPRNL